MAIPPEVKARMEAKAAEARVEFEAHWKERSVRDVADWWLRWCVYGTGTGHDYLGRILIEVTGAKPPIDWPVEYDDY